MKDYVKTLEKQKTKAIIIREATSQYVKDINSILDLSLYFKADERDKFIVDASQAILSKQLEDMFKIIGD